MAFSRCRICQVLCAQNLNVRWTLISLSFAIAILAMTGAYYPSRVADEPIPSLSPMEHAVQAFLSCPDCNDSDASNVLNGRALTRRNFVKVTGSVAAAAATGTFVSPARADRETATAQPEKLLETLYRSLTPPQKEKICFAWDYTDERGLLRSRVENNWSITDRETMNVGGPFFTRDQQELIEAIFFNLYNPEWHDRIRKQLRDDAGGYGKAQTIAFFWIDS